MQHSRKSSGLTKPVRLDTELVRKGFVRSRSEAQAAIEQGKVLVGGVPARRAAALVGPGADIRLADRPSRHVSRGGDKLEGALQRFDVAVAGRRWLDAGVSTGGFTDHLLQSGAANVAAVDVGYGQLAWELRNDPRVVSLERTNVRALEPSDLPWTPNGVMADLSFISLTLVLPALKRVAAEDADFVLLVKPQFEVGKEQVPRGGVVRDPTLWREAVAKVVAAAARLDLALIDVAPSPLPGPAGNREFFIHLRSGAAPNAQALDAAVAEAAAPSAS